MALQELDMELRLTLQSLRAKGSFLPKRLLRELMHRGDEALACFRDELELLAKNPEESRRVAGNLSLYALYILASAKDSKSAEALARICLIEGDWLEAWLGDTIDTDLSSIIAAIMGHKPELIKAVAEEKEAADEIRGTALEALVILAAEGKLPKDKLRTYLVKLLDRRHREDPCFVSAVVVSIMQLYPDDDALKEIQAAYAEDTVESLVVDQRDVWDVSEQHTEEEWLAALPARVGVSLDDPIALLLQLEHFHPRQQPKRNEACPCGSGDKYKDCCA